MAKNDSAEMMVERMDPEFIFGPVWVERDGSLTVHLSTEDAERLIHALPFNYPLAKVIREALRTGGPISPMF